MDSCSFRRNQSFGLLHGGISKCCYTRSKTPFLASGVLQSSNSLTEAAVTSSCRLGFEQGLPGDRRYNQISLGLAILEHCATLTHDLLSFGYWDPVLICIMFPRWVRIADPFKNCVPMTLISHDRNGQMYRTRWEHNTVAAIFAHVLSQRTQKAHQFEAWNFRSSVIWKLSAQGLADGREER